MEAGDSSRGGELNIMWCKESQRRSNAWIALGRLEVVDLRREACLSVGSPRTAAGDRCSERALECGTGYSSEKEKNAKASKTREGLHRALGVAGGLVWEEIDEWDERMLEDVVRRHEVEELDRSRAVGVDVSPFAGLGSAFGEEIGVLVGL